MKLFLSLVSLLDDQGVVFTQRIIKCFSFIVLIHLIVRDENLCRSQYFGGPLLWYHLLLIILLLFHCLLRKLHITTLSRSLSLSVGIVWVQIDVHNVNAITFISLLLAVHLIGQLSRLTTQTVCSFALSEGVPEIDIDLVHCAFFGDGPIFDQIKSSRYIFR